MKTKKLLAVGLAASMVLGANTMVYADVNDLSSEQTGSVVSGVGSLEAYVSSTITKVVVPTSASTNNFIIDPQGLLYLADSTSYTQQNGGVYFQTAAAVKYADGESVTAVKNDGAESIEDALGATIGVNEFYFVDAKGDKYKISASGAGTYTLDKTTNGSTDGAAVDVAIKTKATYDDESADMEIINKSNFEINAKISVALKKKTASDPVALDKVKLVDAKSDLATATDPSLYFAVDMDGTPTAITNTNDSANKDISGIPMVAAAINYAIGDKVYVASEPAGAVTGAKDTDWFAESGTGHTVEYTVAAGDTGIIGQEKVAAVTAGYKLAYYASSVAATAANAENVTHNSDSSRFYGYVLTNSYDFSGQTLTFKLTADVNDVEGWSDAEEVDAKVTYTLTSAESEATMYVSSSTVSSSSLALTLSLPTSVTVTSVALYKSSAPSTPVELNTGGKTHYTVSGTSLSFASTIVTNNVGGKFVITYSDSHKDTITIE